MTTMYLVLGNLIKDHYASTKEEAEAYIQKAMDDLGIEFEIASGSPYHEFWTSVSPIQWYNTITKANIGYKQITVDGEFKPSKWTFVETNNGLHGKVLKIIPKKNK